MSEYNYLLDTTDAQEWAEAFTRRHGGDEGLMLAWFANAIETGRTAGEAKYRTEVDHLRSLVTDIVADFASTEGTHDDVYYVWEQIVRRADGIVADVIRDVSDHDEGWCWDLQLPKEKGNA